MIRFNFLEFFVPQTLFIGGWGMKFNFFFKFFLTLKRSNLHSNG
jgi:hypothetical protein